MSVNNKVKLPGERQTEGNWRMFSCTCIFAIVLFGAVRASEGFNPVPGYRPNVTTCEEFERGARFSPYAVIDAMWKIFYFWSNNTEMYPIIFSIAAKKRVQKIKEVFEAVYPGVDVEWDKATLIMDPRPGVEVLFLYAGTPGAFRALVKKERRNKVRPHPEPLITFADVRMKLVERWMGMMCCEDLTAHALVRVDELPSTEEACLRAAAKIGYQAPGGRSYLYLKEKDKKDEDNKEL